MAPGDYDFLAVLGAQASVGFFFCGARVPPCRGTLCIWCLVDQQWNQIWQRIYVAIQYGAVAGGIEFDWDDENKKHFDAHKVAPAEFEQL